MTNLLNKRHQSWTIHSQQMVDGISERADKEIPRWFQSFFWYRYLPSIRLARYQYFRLVSFPPFCIVPPFFLKRRAELLEKGAITPLLRKKGAIAPFLIPNCTDRVSRWYRYGNYQEILTNTNQKIPIRYTTLVFTLVKSNKVL